MMATKWWILLALIVVLLFLLWFFGFDGSENLFGKPVVIIRPS